MSPAMHRKSVDLPHPDLPRSATISPSYSSKLMSSRTAKGCPSGVVKSLETCETSTMTSPATRRSESMGGWIIGTLLSQRVLGLGQVVEPPPHQAVDHDNIEAHDDHAGQHLCAVASGGRLGDVRAETGRDQAMPSVVGYLGDDRRVPGAARRGDAAGHEVGEHPGEDQLAPSL